MRVQTAKISLTLWTSKVLKDGTSPIVLAIRFGGQSLLSTHFSCKPKDWNKKDECLKRSYPNYSQVNKILQDVKNQAIAAKLKFETEGTPYTPKMIIEEMKPKEFNGNKYDFNTIMEQLFEARHLKYATRVGYKSAFNAMCKLLNKDSFIVTEVTNDVLIKFSKVLLEEHGNPNTVLAYVSKIISVINFANNNEITDYFPTKGNEWVNKHYKKTVHHKALSELTIMKLRSYYNDMPKENLFSRTSKEFSLCFFLSCYALFGIAPIDGAKLHINNFEDVEINYVPCWRINTKRTKTNQPLDIILRKDSDSAEMLRPFIETAHLREGWIFPIIQNNNHDYNYDSEAKQTRNIKAVEAVLNKQLGEIAKELEIPKFTLYSLRHSWATHQINDGTNIGVIANALGRSVSGIGCYINNLTKDEELLKISAL